MFPDSDPSPYDSKKFSKMKQLYTGSHRSSTDLFSYTAEYKQQLFKLRRKGLLTKRSIDVCIMWLLLGQVVARVEWLHVVLQMVKPEKDFSQFSLYLEPKCAGKRNHDLLQSRNSQQPWSLHFGAYPPGFHKGPLFAGALAGNPHLGPEVGKKAQEMLLAAATSHLSKCGLNEYFSRLAIFIPLLAYRINRVAKFSLGAALIHSRIPIWNI